MLSWEQTDKLNEIAKNTTISAEQRKSVIRDIMARWAYDSALGTFPTEPTNFALFGNHEKSEIDPAKEAVKARIPLVGQTGRTYAPGY